MKQNLTKGSLVSSDESVEVKKQHEDPCGDCPWRRVALQGWLGGMTAEEWVASAHGDQAIECHTRHSDKMFIQCAGASIYRSNMAKLPRADAFRFLDVVPLTLPADRAKVFASPVEFVAHHRRK